MSPSLPVVDMREAGAEYRRALRDAAHSVGFFYLTGHGVEARADRLLDAARTFFALPESDRDAVAVARSPHFRGYSDTVLARASANAERRDRFDLGPELPARPIRPGDPGYRILEGPNLWPAVQPGLRAATLDWLAALTAIAGRLLTDLLAAMKVPDGFFDPVVRDSPHVHLKLLHYFGRSADGTGEGVGEHKDYSLLTLLLQDSMGGLQVELPDGRFADVPPVPGSLVVNIGELLETASGGYLRAAVHRVVSPPAGVDRYSAPLFFGPRFDAVVPPLPSPYVTDTTDPGVVCYGERVLRGVSRALPDVVRRHHPYLSLTT